MEPLKPGLYVVSTPIGNLGDITFRAVDILRNSDIVLCEDTRVSRKLFDRYEINTPLRVYNDHSDAKDRDSIIRMVELGKVVSLISDAGTPLICDPGYKLVRGLRDANLHIDIVPGASSILAGLVVSGMPSDSFFFGGFVPRTDHARHLLFESLAKLTSTLVFLETPARLLSTLGSALSALGNRECCVARELTKLHQGVKVATLLECVDAFSGSLALKGELVLLISGNSEDAPPEAVVSDKVIALAHRLLSSGVKAKEVASIICDYFDLSVSRTSLYRLVNSLKNDL